MLLIQYHRRAFELSNQGQRRLVQVLFRLACKDLELEFGLGRELVVAIKMNLCVHKLVECFQLSGHGRQAAHLDPRQCNRVLARTIDLGLRKGNATQNGAGQKRHPKHKPHGPTMRTHLKLQM